MSYPARIRAALAHAFAALGERHHSTTRYL